MEQCTWSDVVLVNVYNTNLLSVFGRETYTMFEQDYIMRKIKDLVRFLASTFLNKDEVSVNRNRKEYTKPIYS